MRRILFVGNSHLAALKNGLAEFNPKLNYEPAFFGLPGDLMTQVGYRGSCLVPTSEKALKTSRALWGHESVDCQEFSAICLLGMGSNIRTLHPLVSDFRATNARIVDERHVISADTYRAAVVGLFEQSLIGFTARNVRSATEKPMFVIPQPAPDHKIIAEATADNAKPGRKKRIRWLQELVNSDEADLLSALVPDGLLKATKAIGYIPQPHETLQTPFTTKSEFMTGSKRLISSRAHERADNIHANARYGQMVLESINELSL